MKKIHPKQNPVFKLPVLSVFYNAAGNKSAMAGCGRRRERRMERAV